MVFGKMLKHVTTVYDNLLHSFGFPRPTTPSWIAARDQTKEGQGEAPSALLCEPAEVTAPNHAGMQNGVIP